MKWVHFVFHVKTVKDDFNTYLTQTYRYYSYHIHKDFFLFVFSPSEDDFLVCLQVVLVTIKIKYEIKA